MAPHLRWVVGDLRTGKIARTIDMPGGRWSADIADKGALEGSVNLAAGDWRFARADATPAKSFLAVAYVDAFGAEHWKAGGPIWTTKYSDDDGMLTVGAASLSSYFDHRKVMPVLATGQDPARAVVRFEARRLELIAKRLIEASREHVGGELPIVFPTDAELGGEGKDHYRNFEGFELGWVGTRLEQLTQVIGGPEVQFEPRRRGDDPRYIEWVMRIGTVETDMMLSQDGPEWVFDRTVRDSAVEGIDVDTDGSIVAFRSWAAGMGEGVTRPVEHVDNLDPVRHLGWPLLESEVTSLDSVSGRETLRRHATGDLMGRQRPVEEWSLKVRANGTPHLGQYRAGDWCLVRVRDHVYIPDGDYRMRITGLSGRDGEPVSLSLAPRVGEF